MIVIKPLGGLCNYLRVVFSYYNQFCTLIKHKVDYTKTETCNGHFLDYFESIVNIEFVQDDKKYKVDYTGHSWHPKYCPCHVFIYDKLILRQYLKNIIMHKREMLDNNHIALNIRKADHNIVAKKYNQYTSDKDFIKFLDECELNKLYIVTDNRSTYQ
jgi:hypothetical protein